MMPVRRAGSGSTAGSDHVTWSVAEGVRGRRWREVVAGEGAVRHSLLLETDPLGRFTHLELATPAGLLTLHPEGDGTVHGNVVQADGIRHVVGLPWDADGSVIVEGSPIARAALAHLLRHAVAGGASTTRTILRIDRDLGLTIGPARIVRLEMDTWQIDGDARFSVTTDGLPEVAGGSAWSTEADPTG